MKKAILGKKIGMTQVFDENGTMIPVTVIEAGPCAVIQKKDVENDGYEAVVVAYDDKAERLVNKPEKGKFAKAGVSCKRHVREFRLDDCSTLNVADEIKVDTFEAGERVDVTGISKGKGFAGVIKRYGQHRLKETHGTGPVHRHAGSMGGCSYPGRVFKGKRLPGHMGHVRVTVQNLDIIRVDAERGLLLVKGAVPGPKGGLVTVKNTVKA